MTRIFSRRFTAKTFSMVFLALLLLLGTSTLFAQSEAPDIVINGFTAYQKSGAAAAVAAWMKDSPIENDTTARAGLVGGMSQIQAAYGNVTGLESVRTVPISPSVRFVYVVLKFERGPVFARFDCYNTGKSWIITQLVLNTKAAEVWPQNLLIGK